MSRRDEILAAATLIERNDGLDGLSVRRVADAAGIGASTLRHYFPTQADLQAAVFTAAGRGVLDDGDISDAARPAVDRLLDRLEQFLLSDDLRLIGYAALLRARGFGNEDPKPAVRALIDSVYASGTANITGWLVVLADEGSLQRDEIPALRACIMALLDGFGMRRFLGVDDNVDEARKALRWFILRTTAITESAT